MTRSQVTVTFLAVSSVSLTEIGNLLSRDLPNNVCWNRTCLGAPSSSPRFHPSSLASRRRGTCEEALFGGHQLEGRVSYLGLDRKVGVFLWCQ